MSDTTEDAKDVADEIQAAGWRPLGQRTSVLSPAQNMPQEACHRDVRSPAEPRRHPWTKRDFCARKTPHNEPEAPMTRCRLDVDPEGWTVRPRTRQTRKEPTMPTIHAVSLDETRAAHLNNKGGE